MAYAAGGESSTMLLVLNGLDGTEELAIPASTMRMVNWSGAAMISVHYHKGDPNERDQHAGYLQGGKRFAQEYPRQQGSNDRRLRQCSHGQGQIALGDTELPEGIHDGNEPGLCQTGARADHVGLGDPDIQEAAQRLLEGADSGGALHI